MKKIIWLSIILILLSGCFDPPDITPPTFIAKNAPDSLNETGIDAYLGNAIYLEWEEPESATNEGIKDYYLYRGIMLNGEYQFEHIATIDRGTGFIEASDYYVDYDVHQDTTYYYYLKSHNNFAISQSTSDTVDYKLTSRPTSLTPTGDIQNIRPSFYFAFPSRTVNRISYFYLRLYYYDQTEYKIKLFLKKFRYHISASQYYMYLDNNDSYTTVLIDSLWTNSSSQKYLIQGNYRWRIDAVSSEPGGGPEMEGSESDWMYFTVK